MGAASCDPSDRRRLIHAPADSGRPQPLEDSPRGYEDFTRESTGSDVFSQSAPPRVPQHHNCRRAPRWRRRQGATANPGRGPTLSPPRSVSRRRRPSRPADSPSTPPHRKSETDRTRAHLLPSATWPPTRKTRWPPPARWSTAWTWTATRCSSPMAMSCGVPTTAAAAAGGDSATGTPRAATPSQQGFDGMPRVARHGSGPAPLHAAIETRLATVDTMHHLGPRRARHPQGRAAAPGRRDERRSRTRRRVDGPAAAGVHQRRRVGRRGGGAGQGGRAAVSSWRVAVGLAGTARGPARRRGGPGRDAGEDRAGESLRVGGASAASVPVAAAPARGTT